MDPFLDFFFLPAKDDQKRKINGHNIPFSKNIENIFPYSTQNRLTKKKTTQNDKASDENACDIRCFFLFQVLIGAKKKK